MRGRDAHWSPDRRLIVYTPPNGGVATIPAARAGSRLLSRGYEADWAPEGRRIVIARLGGPASDDSIWIMNRDGSGRRRIVQGATTPAWRPHRG